MDEFFQKDIVTLIDWRVCLVSTEMVACLAAMKGKFADAPIFSKFLMIISTWWLKFAD